MLIPIHATGPVIHTNPERPCIETGVSIREFVQDRLLFEDLFDGPIGPITDDESCGSDDEASSNADGGYAASAEDGPTSSAAPLKHGTAMGGLGPPPGTSSQCSPAAGGLVPTTSPSLVPKRTGKPMSDHRRAKRQAYSHRQQAIKRAKKQAETGMDCKGVVMKRQLEAAKQAIQVKFNLLDDARVSRSGYVGKGMDGMPRIQPTLSEVIEMGATHFPWDGRWVFLQSAGPRLMAL